MFSCSSQCHVPHKVPQFFSLESSLIFSSLAVSFFLDLKKDTNCFPTNASTSAVNNHDLLDLSRISPWRCTERSRGSCLPWGKRIDFSPRSLHTSMAHSHGRTIWGQALLTVVTPVEASGMLLCQLGALRTILQPPERSRTPALPCTLHSKGWARFLWGWGRLPQGRSSSISL